MRIIVIPDQGEHEFPARRSNFFESFSTNKKGDTNVFVGPVDNEDSATHDDWGSTSGGEADDHIDKGYWVDGPTLVIRVHRHPRRKMIIHTEAGDIPPVEVSAHATQSRGWGPYDIRSQ